MEIKKTIFIIAFCFLTSCSSNSSNKDFSELANIFKEMTKKVEFKTYTSEMFKDINYPIIEIRTNGLVKQLLMLPLTKRENYFNYSSGSGQSITFDGQQITKTNGFETHLLSMETKSDIYESLSSGIFPLEHEKKYSFLTPDYNIETINFFCTIKFIDNENIAVFEDDYKTIKLEEVCISQNYSFENFYWVDNENFIWKSKQWISLNNIYADIRVLKKI